VTSIIDFFFSIQIVIEYNCI